MRISKKSQYGLRAMVYLTNIQSKDKVFSLKEISKKEGIPFDFLEKIFSKLKEAKLVEAKRGKRGGYFLAKKPKKITVGQIIKALEGSLAPVLCIADERERRISCPKKRNCKAKKVWEKIQEILKANLNSITLADLIKKL